MKHIFLLILAAGALAGNGLPVRAGSLVEDRYGDQFGEGKLRQIGKHFYRSHEEDQFEARQDAIAQASIATDQALQRQIDVNTQIAINEEARAQRGELALAAKAQAVVAQAEAQAHAQAAQADLAARLAYDDEVTIKNYLEEHGYRNPSDAQIAKVLAYMKDHWIHHVSELGQ